MKNVILLSAAFMLTALVSCKKETITPPAPCAHETFHTQLMGHQTIVALQADSTSEWHYFSDTLGSTDAKLVLDFTADDVSLSQIDTNGAIQEVSQSLWNNSYYIATDSTFYVWGWDMECAAHHLTGDTLLLRLKNGEGYKLIKQ